MWNNWSDGTELYHYGVPGMRWGVRKSVYKSMTRDQRKRTRRRYRKTPLGKMETAVDIGTILGGPIVGVSAGVVVGKRNGLFDKQCKSGEDLFKKYANVRIETDIDKVDRIMKERKVAYDDRVYDPYGNVVAIFQGND